MIAPRSAPPTPARRLLHAALAAALALLAAQTLAAQTIDWTARKGGPIVDGDANPGSGDFIRGKRALAVDGNGNVYVTGRSHNGSNYDYLTVAYDAGGTELWAKVKNGAANRDDQAYALAVDGGGTVYVTGSSNNGSTTDYLTVAYDASGTELWAKVKNGAANSNDLAYALSVDGSENVYVTGSSQNSSTTDYLTVAYDASGTELWAKVKNGVANSSDAAYALAVDGSGNVYVTGFSSNGSNEDYLTVAYDASGTELWTRVKNGAANNQDFAHALAVDGSGTVYVTGYSWSGSNNDCLTVAYDAGGTELWAKVKNGAANGHDFAYALAVDGSGHVYVTGYSWNGSNWDYLTVAYDASGTELWTRVKNGAANGQDYAYALAVDGSGNVYVTGRSNNGANYDYLTVAYDASGTELWARVKNGAANGQDHAYALAVDGSGHVYVTGYSHNGSNWDYLTVAYDASGTELWAQKEPPTRWYVERPGSGDAVLGKRALAVDGSGTVYVTGVSSSGSNSDYLTVAYDASGTELWARVKNGAANSNDLAYALAVDGSGIVYVTGISSNGSNSDYLTVAYDASGTELWARVKNGAANRDDSASAVAVDGSGNVYVTGSSDNGSNYDYLTVAYDASGTELWAKVKNGAANRDDNTYALAVDGSGTVYVTGTSSNGSNYDCLTVAYDASGTELWAKVKNGAANGQDYAFALAVDGSGTVYVTGASSNGANYDYLTVAYDASGTELWAKVKNGAANSYDEAYALAVDGSGIVYVTGVSHNGSNTDYLTVAYDASGTELWSKVKNGAANSYDEAYALSVDGSGNVYVTGYSSNGSNTDYLTVAYDASGTELWDLAIDAGSEDQAYAIAVDAAGGVIVSGWSIGGAADFFTVRIATAGDTTPPTDPAIVGTSPLAGSWSNDNTVAVTWSGAADDVGGSGLAGYSVEWNHASVSTPDAVVDLAHTADPHSTTSAALVPDGNDWYFHLRTCDVAGNCTATVHAGPFWIDTAAPTGLAVASTSHTVSTWSNDNTIDFGFSGATDPNGLAGYSLVFDQLATTDPDGTVDQAGTIFTGTASPDGSSWYVHVRACDPAGNCGATVHAGPYWIDTAAPGGPGAVTSLSHGDGQPKSDDTIDIAWGAASDTLSGVALYRYGFSNSATPPACGSLSTTTATLAGASGNLSGGTWYAHVCAVDNAGNAGAVTTGGPYVVDTAGPTGLAVASTSHVVSTWSNDPTIDFGFSGATDPNGLAGYSLVFDQLAATDPDGTVDQAGTTLIGFALPDSSSWSLHVRACDAAGNCGATVHAGPFWVDTGDPSSPGTVSSSSHSGTPTNDPTIEVSWGAATDGLSGVAGYWVGFDANPTAACGETNVTADTTATSNPLGTGSWYAHVCVVDAAGNWGPVVHGGPYAIDATPPRVASVSTVRDTGDGTLSEGEVTSASITQVYLTFDEAVGGPLTDPGSYRVTGAGPDLMLQTVGCGPLGGDDVAVPIASVAHDAGAHRSAVRLAGALALPVGLYRSAACATLTDAVGNALDGDGDGTGGDDFGRLFGVELTDLLANPNFDIDLAGWSGAATWSGADAESKPTSGAARFESAAGSGATRALAQCLVAMPGEGFRASASTRVTSATPGAPGVALRLAFHSGPACGGGALDTKQLTLAAGSTGGLWLAGEVRGAKAPASAGSVALVLEVGEGAAPAYTVDLDLPLLAADLDLLVDGFEGGELCAWSVAVGGSACP